MRTALKIVLLSIFVIFLISGVSFALRPITPVVKRSFAIFLQQDVDTTPGTTVKLDGKLLNTGMYNLYDFNISIKDIPFKYRVTPTHIDKFPIILGYNPGYQAHGRLYRQPVNFSIEIEIPQDAAGDYLMNVIGQEFNSADQIRNGTSVSLRVSTVPRFSVTDIEVPETVTESQPFNISFSVENAGLTNEVVKVSVEIPSDWSVSEQTQGLVAFANSSIPLTFTITPTNSSGQIAVVLQYPYAGAVFNITKQGPFLIPTTPGVMPTGVAILPSILQFVNSNPVATIILVIAVLLIIWYMVTGYAGGRKKPEEMKKKETKASDVSESLKLMQ